MPFAITRNPPNPHYTILHSNPDDLTRRVRQLEGELKRKLTEDSLLRNLFKAKKPHEHTHIDLYLQMREMEGQLSEVRAEAERLQREKEEQEGLHINTLQEMGARVSEKEEEWGNEKVKLKGIIDDLQDEQHTLTYLLEEMKRKNEHLIRRNKELAEEMEIEREARVLEQVRDQD